MNPPLFLPVIAGPTASGKTALAVELAKRLNGEVVSADSMQIYDGLRIGTARPTAEEMRGIPHHLQGFLPLSEPYSVAQYCEDAHRVIADIHARGKLPILCGGTGLYIDSVIDNVQFFGDGSDPVQRQKLQERAAAEGAEALLEELRAIDPPTAERLHPNNQGRIIRALELYYTAGITMSQQMALSRSVPTPYKPCVLVLDCKNRQFLYDRIHRRVDIMLAEGLLEEAAQALQAPTAPTALQAIGYKELQPWFEGTLPLEVAVDNLKKATRHYAKRQLSWFHRRKEAHTLTIDTIGSLDELADAAEAILKEAAHGTLC